MDWFELSEDGVETVGQVEGSSAYQLVVESDGAAMEAAGAVVAEGAAAAGVAGAGAGVLTDTVTVTVRVATVSYFA